MYGSASFDLQENLICYPISELDTSLKREWKTWISSTLRRLRGLEQGLKEMPSSRIDRLKMTQTAKVILQAEKRDLSSTGRFTPAPANKVQDSRHPELKPKTILDFLFKSCKMDFQQSLSLLEQLREQLHNQRREQTKSKGRGEYAGG